MIAQYKTNAAAAQEAQAAANAEQRRYFVIHRGPRTLWTIWPADEYKDWADYIALIVAPKEQP